MSTNKIFLYFFAVILISAGLYFALDRYVYGEKSQINAVVSVLSERFPESDFPSLYQSIQTVEIPEKYSELLDLSVVETQDYTFSVLDRYRVSVRHTAVTDGLGQPEVLIADISEENVFQVWRTEHFDFFEIIQSSLLEKSVEMIEGNFDTELISSSYKLLQETYSVTIDDVRNATSLDEANALARLLTLKVILSDGEIDISGGVGKFETDKVRGYVLIGKEGNHNIQIFPVDEENRVFWFTKIDGQVTLEDVLVIISSFQFIN